MKTLIFAVFLLVCAPSFAESVTFCYWDCTAITEAVAPDGTKEYTAHYKGQRYTLSLDQFQKLESGYDITIIK